MSKAGNMTDMFMKGYPRDAMSPMKASWVACSASATSASRSSDCNTFRMGGAANSGPPIACRK